MQCPICGSTNRDGTNFCRICGSRLNGTAPEPAPAQRPEPVPEPYPAPNPSTDHHTNQSISLNTNPHTTPAPPAVNYYRTQARKPRSYAWVYVTLIVILTAALGVGTYFLLSHLFSDKNNTVAVSEDVTVISADNDADSNAAADTAEQKDDQNGDSDADASSYKDDPADFYGLGASKRYLTEDDISWMSVGQLQFAINELYAKNGFEFVKGDEKTYFEKQDWYHPDTKTMATAAERMNDCEKKNIELMAARRNTLMKK